MAEPQKSCHKTCSKTKFDFYNLNKRGKEGYVHICGVECEAEFCSVRTAIWLSVCLLYQRV
jgi:hypothetical protein